MMNNKSLIISGGAIISNRIMNTNRCYGLIRIFFPRIVDLKCLCEIRYTEDKVEYMFGIKFGASKLI